jgi:hypothetical protein
MYRFDLVSGSLAIQDASVHLIPFWSNSAEMAAT